MSARMYQMTGYSRYEDYKGNIDLDEPRSQGAFGGIHKDYMDKLDKLDRRRRHILRELSILNQKRAQLLNINAPVHKLPYELFWIIFRFASAPEVISSVCRHWRTMALSMVSLWSTIYIDTGRVIDLNVLEHKKDGIKLYLTRTQRAKLSFIIETDNWRIPQSITLLDVIESELDRVASLAINIRCYESPSVTNLLSKLGSRLQNLEIASDSHTRPQTIALPKSATNLQSLHLRGFPILTYTPASYPQLQYLELHAVDGRFPDVSMWMTALPLLQGASHLETLIMYHFEFNPDSSSSLVTLPHLRRIMMASMENSSMEHVLARLALPGLQSLVIRNQVSEASFVPILPDFTLRTVRNYNSWCLSGTVDDVIWKKGPDEA